MQFELPTSWKQSHRRVTCDSRAASEALVIEFVHWSVIDVSQMQVFLENSMMKFLWRPITTTKKQKLISYNLLVIL